MVEVLAVSKAVCCTHHADRASDALSEPQGEEDRPESTAHPQEYGRRSCRPYDRVVARGQVRTTFWPMLGRALLRRCPRCGGKGWFRGWFGKVDRCRTCGYRYERQPGFLLGAVTINTIVTFGLLAAVLLVGSILSYPDIAVGADADRRRPSWRWWCPIVFYPFSYTIWAAVDLTMRPLDAAEQADAAAHAGDAAPLDPARVLERTLVRSYAAVVLPGNSVTPPL